MTSSRLPFALAAALVLVTAGAASAQNHGGQAAAQARHDRFKEIGKAFKGVNDQLKTGAPDMAVVKANAATVKTLSSQLPSWFVKGSGPADGVKTEAKPEAFSDPAGFAKAADAFKVQAAKLEQTANAGADVTILRAQFAATGATCKGCHDKYRVPDQH